jgi:hypothetical protein
LAATDFKLVESERIRYPTVISQVNDNSTVLSWTDRDWDQLIAKVRIPKITPFLGAGASSPPLRLGSAIAKDWAHKSPRYDYPFPDDSNLARVAQYVAIEEEDIDAPKTLILDEFKDKPRPDFSRTDEIHRVVADLNLPIYITTNYDDFMTRALERDNAKKPQRILCNWHLVKRGVKLPKIELRDVTPSAPLVFHLHGHLDKIDSLVLTEDDYLDFLISLSKSPTYLLPSCVEDAFTTSSLLFLGYSLEDMDFKVIFRKLATYPGIGRKHFSVQLEPKAAGEPPSPEEVQRANKQLRYLSKQFGSIAVKVFWGSCQDFAAELHKHWSNRPR